MFGAEEVSAPNFEKKMAVYTPYSITLCFIRCAGDRVPDVLQTATPRTQHIAGSMYNMHPRNKTRGAIFRDRNTPESPAVKAGDAEMTMCSQRCSSRKNAHSASKIGRPQKQRQRQRQHEEQRSVAPVRWAAPWHTQP